jgi:hypothetical protein
MCDPSGILNVQERNEQSTQSDNELDTLHIAQSTYTIGERTRVPTIPYSVIKWRREEELERMQEFQNMNEEERHQYEEDRLKNDDINDLERKIKNNRVKKLMKTNGGEGYSLFQIEQFSFLRTLTGRIISYLNSSTKRKSSIMLILIFSRNYRN